MQIPEFSLPVSRESRLARGWLFTGIIALALSGIFSILLVAARTPALAEVGAFKDFFHVTLVVHVDLSVLVWFLAILGMLWSLVRSEALLRIPYLDGAALGCFALGALALALSPLHGTGVPLMSNYIPVLTNPVFFAGLALLFTGVLLALIGLFLDRGCWSGVTRTAADVQRFGIVSSGMITAMALACFAWSYAALDAPITGEEYYNTIFWGGGHVLQIAYAQGVMVAWLWLASAIGLPQPLSNLWLCRLFALGIFAALISPLGYLLHTVSSFEHMQFFTRKMIALAGAGAGILGLFLLPPLFRHGWPRKANRALWAALIMSLILFAYGGILAFLIQGANVIIPAHYHGSIVGVTLALMGLAYALLPRFGYTEVGSWRMAYIQPILYGGGQLLHISGLAWSGGYGVLRKTPGALEGGFTAAKVAMGLMGMGGLLAVIGGLLFVLVVIRSVWSSRTS